MAEPYQKNGRWYVRYKDGKGAWRDKATGARTKTEARRLQLELERQTERQRLGLEPLPSDTPEMTFGAAMDLWWSEHGRRLRSHTIRRFMDKHLRAELGPLTLSQVGERLESVLNAKVGALGPESLNHLRAAVHRVYAFLTRRGAWKGANPAFAVPRFKVPKRLPQYLRPEEVRLMLAALDARWRGLFATAVYLGLRRGEVIALRKSDVDLDVGAIRVGVGAHEKTRESEPASGRGMLSGDADPREREHRRWPLSSRGCQGRPILARRSRELRPLQAPVQGARTSRTNVGHPLATWRLPSGVLGARR